ncbi:hypothetical protein KSD_67610 [Ktedonobacter sp. SOSP1-85]|uniref:serine/threonine-protein kinase n=1 Tax=Ktedonobacter sp. SOSP1-85 TaxID=2778367 RepID=UPI001914E3EF|nr:serine/threonine-protein kinase [Ktedonobacter sp. SOSP1-85]GHO78990.1 hypothetical protein KSD_67610 [Ktedonobacter sp. SOSP1-85]
MPLDGLQIHNYRLLRLVGSGGMGEIYLADDIRLARQVAVKVVHTEEDEDEGSETSSKALRLFQREARTISMLDHPHILPLFDYGETTLNTAQLTYLVMPYHAEGSLDIWLRKRRRAMLLPPQMVAQIVRQAADALQYAHDHHVIHQDVKSSNFLVSNSHVQPDVPHLLLSDFGLARLRLGNSNSSKHARGTPNYMAPEQWRGEAVPASDQYSLAIMTYKLLTGQYPFQGDAVSILYQHIQAAPPDASQLNSQVSPGASAVIQRGLAKKPKERYPNIVAFAQAFQQAIDGPTESNELVLEHSTSEFSVELPSQLFRTQFHSASQNASFQIASSPQTPSSEYGTPSSPITGVDWPEPSLHTSEPTGSGDAPEAPLPLPGEIQLKQISSKLEQSGSASIFKPANIDDDGQDPPLPTWNTGDDKNKGRKGRRRRFLLAVIILLILLALLGTFVLNTVLNDHTSTLVTGGSPGTQTPITTVSPATSNTPGGVRPSPTSAGVVGVPTPVSKARATSTVASLTPTPTGTTTTNPFQVQGIDIAFDPPTISTSCGGIATVTYIATITVSDNSPGGEVDVKYSSDNGASYNTTTLTFATGETSQSFSFSRQLTISLNLLNLIKLDVEHTGIVTTTSPNVVTKSAAPSEGCH